MPPDGLLTATMQALPLGCNLVALGCRQPDDQCVAEIMNALSERGRRLTCDGIGQGFLWPGTVTEPAVGLPALVHPSVVHARRASRVRAPFLAWTGVGFTFRLAVARMARDTKYWLEPLRPHVIGDDAVFSDA